MYKKCTTDTNLKYYIVGAINYLGDFYWLNFFNIWNHICTIAHMQYFVIGISGSETIITTLASAVPAMYTWCLYWEWTLEEVKDYVLTAGYCHIISMVAGSTDSCAVPAGEEVEVIGGLTVHTVQEDCTIALTKTARKNLYLVFSHAWTWTIQTIPSPGLDAIQSHPLYFTVASFRYTVHKVTSVRCTCNIVHTGLSFNCPYEMNGELTCLEYMWAPFD